RISGGLLSSPCTLETNELPLPTERYGKEKEIRIIVSGCGDGNSDTGTVSQLFPGQGKTIAIHAMKLIATDNDVVLQRKHSDKIAGIRIRNGINQFIYFLNYKRKLSDCFSLTGKHDNYKLQNISLKFYIAYE
ncbi:hypothetical protein IRP16_004178, partial [Salmonella enterica]|nr:hypothetical protein [Salmonella enterica]